MPYIPVPQTVGVQAVFELSGEVVENTMYFEAMSSPPTEAQISDLLNIVRTHIEEDLLPLLSNAIQLVRLIGTLLTAVDSLSVVLNVSPPVSGSDNGGALPNNASYTVTFLTAQRGRSFRGRNYIAGIPISAVTGNNVHATFRTGLLAYYDALQAEVEAADWQMVVVSRFHNKAPRSVGVKTAINGFTTYDTVVDSQRRRLPGRGT